MHFQINAVKRCRYPERVAAGRVTKSSLNSTDTSQTQALQTAVSIASDRHVAKSYEDTSQGAVHTYQDEYGELRVINDPMSKLQCCSNCD